MSLSFFVPFLFPFPFLLLSLFLAHYFSSFFLFSTNTFSSYFLLNITPCNKIFLSRFPLKTTLLTLSLYFFFLLRFFYSPPLFPFDFFYPPSFLYNSHIFIKVLLVPHVLLEYCFFFFHIKVLFNKKIF